MTKEYTPIRKFYAWVGFIATIGIIVYGIFAGMSVLDRRDQALMNIHYCHNVNAQGEVVAWRC